ncbi:MAG: AsmA family protein [Proteobacteria bacterium]|jgi:AsmA protein|nr:AsmA family protein [Desulfocapsa sp.]MBU3943234.1 AsmA family protein [Pseudomonadota bacterium]MCG2744740.1 AsmA family protein [Desulfobacteraceae bacterium]MBU3983594.1 AsmA family protein [Pseudomonadota bacterium]MBU4027870.1 AsmA family protein [Pseudomonadota bacterium]
MNKILKFCLLGAGVIIGLALVVVVYVVATFNPNDYKGKIIEAVKGSTQRTLSIDGDIKLSFFPKIGAELGKVSLSDFKSDSEFSSVENVHVSLALMPLLSRQVVVDEVMVSGLQTTLVKHKDGTTNIDDLLGKDEKGGQGSKAAKKDVSDPQGVNFDVAAVSLENTSLTYRDEATGAHFVVKDLKFNTGRIANGLPTEINLSVGVQANQPKLDLTSEIKTRLTFDLDKKHYQLEGMELQVSGSALDISNLKVQASGDASVDMSTQTFTVGNLSLKAAGVKGKDPFDAILVVPGLSLAKDKFSGDKLTVNGNFDGDSGKIVIALSLMDLEGSQQAFKSSALTLDVDMKQPEQMLQVKLTSPLEGNLQARQFTMNDLILAMNASGDKLPNKSVRSEMKGSLQVDATKERVQLALAGGLLQSQVKANVGVNGFTSPAIQFNVEADQFDADLYLPEKAEKTAEAPKAKETEQALDLSGLRKLNLDGTLRVGSLKVANVKLAQVRVDVKAQNGQVNLSPLSANLYDGSMSGSLAVNAQATPIIAIKQNLTGINVAPLTKDAANLDTLEGRGNIGMDLTMQGNTVSEMKKAMHGIISVNLVDGSIKGINIAKHLRDAKNILSMGGASTQTQSANNAEKTDFSELKATFKVNKGVAHNDDLSLKSPLLRVLGSGDINIGNDSMDYLAKATLANTLKGQGGQFNVSGITVPVRAKGPFSDLQYTLDFGVMVGEAAKQKVETEVKTRVQDQLKNSLQGLFK